VPLRSLIRVACLTVEDLLEHLAHARPHQGVLVGVGVMIATPDPGQLARIELVVALVIHRIGDVVAVVVHAGIVAPGGGSVNGLDESASARVAA